MEISRVSKIAQDQPCNVGNQLINQTEFNNFVFQALQSAVFFVFFGWVVGGEGFLGDVQIHLIPPGSPRGKNPTCLKPRIHKTSQQHFQYFL